MNTIELRISRKELQELRQADISGDEFLDTLLKKLMFDHPLAPGTPSFMIKPARYYDEDEVTSTLCIMNTPDNRPEAVLDRILEKKGLVPQNTPDTEWEKEFDKQYTHGGEWWKEGVIITPSMVKSFIREIRASRDTHWKERVRKDYQALKETPAYVNLMTQWGQLDEDGVCIAVSRQALEETTQALDTLLDNLK